MDAERQWAAGRRWSDWGWATKGRWQGRVGPAAVASAGGAGAWGQVAGRGAMDGGRRFDPRSNARSY
ncbi:hypothetical protein WMF37_03750 [Sorangium sp. So ce291]|uniref:hypothetical protein n=1 Tax=Sorangium sp. So ce291 TaxID=3133294 RepID=UPI003F63F169